MDLTLNKIIELITYALEVEPGVIQETTRASDIEDWDSLGHISILSEIDKAFNNITEKCPGLASASSVKDVYEALIDAMGN
jgi:acyl carrier protein